MSGGATGLKRIQGTYVSDNEVKRVVAYLAGVTTPEYRLDIIEDQKEGSFVLGQEGQFEDDDDALYEEVKDFVIQTQKASASLLQRRFRLGYARAARLLDMLEAEGVIGPQEGAKPRKVLVNASDK
jgi:S-DNA-T family DNA segregation ATPase FtsK/SpoIIIE